MGSAPPVGQAAPTEPLANQLGHHFLQPVSSSTLSEPCSPGEQQFTQLGKRINISQPPGNGTNSTVHLQTWPAPLAMTSGCSAGHHAPTGSLLPPMPFLIPLAAFQISITGFKGEEERRKVEISGWIQDWQFGGKPDCKGSSPEQLVPLLTW